MIITVICYTICSLSDKYAVSKAGFNGDEFTFLMASATSFFMLFALPFSEIYFTFSWHSILAVLMVVLIKWLEFQCSAKVLTELSAFELKAWLGITLFFSYLTDLMLGSQARFSKFLFIGITTVGLIFIAQAGRKENIQYRKIIIPLIVYLSVKFGYGVTVKISRPFINSTLLLFTGFIILTAILLFKVNPRNLIRQNRTGLIIVSVTKIPNVIGMLTENAVISVSLSNYSFIQPMILCSLFFIGILRKEQYSRKSLAGSIICIIGIVGFQLL